MFKKKYLKSILMIIVTITFSIIILTTFYNSIQNIQISKSQIQNYENEEDVSTIPIISDLSLGSKFSSMIVKDKNNTENLYMWGGLMDQNGDPSNIFVPTNINVDKGKPGIQGSITYMSSGNNSIGVVINDDEGVDHLYMWGKNDEGQLGNGTENNSNVPTEINYDGWGEDKIQGEITNLDLGSKHSGVVINDKEGTDHLYMWGKNEYGQLGYDTLDNDDGDDHYNSSTIPFEVDLDGNSDGIQGTVTNLSLGSNHSGVVINDDEGDHLYMWGYNLDGQIGDGTDSNAYTPKEIDVDEGDYGIQGTITNLSLGTFHSGVVIQTTVKDGQTTDHLYMWGSNYYGQLGNGTTNEIRVPTEIDVDGGNDGIQGTITNLSLGKNNSSVVIEDYNGDDHLYVWGENKLGQVNSSLGDILEPIEVNFDGGESGIQGNIVDLSLGDSSTGLIIQNKEGINHLYMSGNNSNGQIGNGISSEEPNNPREVFSYFTGIPQGPTINSVNIIDDSITDTTATLEYSINIPEGDYIYTQDIFITNIKVTDGTYDYGSIDIADNEILENGKIELTGLNPEQKYNNLFIVIEAEGQESTLSIIINADDSIPEGHIGGLKLSISMIILYLGLIIIAIGLIIGSILGLIWYLIRRKSTMKMI